MLDNVIVIFILQMGDIQNVTFHVIQRFVHLWV